MAELVQERSANLVNDKKIRFQTIVNVISHLGNNEKEVFYMGGDIPAKYVEIDMSKSGCHKWVTVEEYMRRMVSPAAGMI
ncbi:hypothetical protein C1Y31_16225 [Pseudomonas sp. FW305-25]|nr:hypothetical protein C1Y35_21965 [Pseudomonas sp. GW456-L14]PMY47815.1 hypothetical protein C1Y34_31175 [Pseudomonas sp. GW456-L12]PMY64819.1 hypothetical protein C1Y31_16225 [Pseudomonas sp. FW305-25]PMY69261.1 hypothetical protein C1Y32_17005 [Pseudomonas sp. FW126-L8]PNA80050.1 hypothetical protein C1Y33_12535 [Pseudomonas sp. FW305-76]